MFCHKARIEKNASKLVVSHGVVLCKIITEILIENTIFVI